MKKQESNSFNRASEEAKKNLASNSTDWKEVIVDIIIKIITLGFYHLEKHKNK